MPTILRARQIELLSEGIAILGISVRTSNALEEAGIFTIGGLLQKTEEEIRSIENVGDKTMSEIFESLAALGFHREGKEPKDGEDAETLIEKRRRMYRELYGVQEKRE